MWPFSRKPTKLDKKVEDAILANRESIVRAKEADPRIKELRKIYNENGIFRLIMDSMR
jgi:hypothetical protein